MTRRVCQDCERIALRFGLWLFCYGLMVGGVTVWLIAERVAGR